MTNSLLLLVLRKADRLSTNLSGVKATLSRSATGAEWWFKPMVKKGIKFLSFLRLRKDSAL
ncbi:hypothetical protein ACFO4O_05910 [Glaciecola siphonariae]|uniref:Uncharacterized protein n=1 Tax=Glaciecola siphonariae TaxID=521012 RepID=A0ABV9LV30_9ALTE